VGASAEDATDGVPEVFHAGREAPRVRVAMTWSTMRRFTVNSDF
jgi:hypothetical protein